MATALFNLKQDSCPGICCWGDRLSADAAARSLWGLCWPGPCVHQQQGPHKRPSYQFRVCVCVIDWRKCCRLDFTSLLCSVAVGKARHHERGCCWCCCCCCPSWDLFKGTIVSKSSWNVDRQDSDRHACASTCAHVHAWKRTSVGFRFRCIFLCKHSRPGW